jgi:hypothetical protein
MIFLANKRLCVDNPWSGCTVNNEFYDLKLPEKLLKTFRKCLLTQWDLLIATDAFVSDDGLIG